jgi:hypothetical protein
VEWKVKNRIVWRRQKIGETAKKYVSDIIDLSDADYYKFNLIASGCGTGKSYFVTRNLFEQMSDIKPEEVIFVTSRALTVDQQSRIEGVVKFNPQDTNLINFWNNDDRIDEAAISSGIRIMTYDKIINILSDKNTVEKETLSGVKAIVFDECHALFSDLFIKDMLTLQVWIRDILYEGKKLIIGMTATPGILEYNSKRWGVSIKRLNKEILTSYKASRMICTNFDTIPYLVATNRLPGKTLILCVSVKDCYVLHQQIPNSTVLVSKNNKEFTHEMKMIRDYISKYEKLPDKYFVPSYEEVERRKAGRHAKQDDGTWHDLNVLITTTMAREGYNLSEDSGIKNIVSCFGDDLHLTQICGRARYNLENIVVAHTRIPYDNLGQSPYLTEQRKLFSEYMGNKQNTKWFSSVSHLVNHDVYGIKRFTLGTDESKFVQYINTKWLVPPDTPREESDKYKIWREEDKSEIVQMCIKCKMLAVPDRLVTFSRVIKLLEGCLGYVIDSGRIVRCNQRYTYKLVVSYDEENSTYSGVVAGENDFVNVKIPQQCATI